MLSMRVTKTLVIGLGSTGTRICDAVADRLAWELGSLSQAPWVRFLSVETDSNQESQLHASGDFCTLTIPASDYVQMIEDSSAYDEKIRLSSWIDKTTIDKLPGREVSAGAGNIRMVGRLAFLCPDNYTRLRQLVQDRVNSLRELSEATAAERRGQLADGSNPDIEFGANGEVRVIVAGTLCGGTCSGVLSDFGYFLKTILTPSERIIGVFTLPRPEMTPANEPKANRYKRNAYAALTELNHYCLTSRGTEASIRFPDGLEPDVKLFPYDLPYIVVPRQVGDESEQELTIGVAERVFLNIMVPETDPFGKAVDATVFDRDHRAHVFCTFGLSLLEFPVQQVIEACSKKIVAHALREWRNRPMDEAKERQHLAELGLTWDALVEALCRVEGGESLKRSLDRKKAELIDLARSDGRAAEEGVDYLRRSFGLGDARTAESPGALVPGSVPRVMYGNTRGVAEQTLGALRSHVGRSLIEYHSGPAPLRQLLRKLNERVAQLKREAQSPVEVPSEDRVDSCLKRIRAYQQSPLLQFLGLRRKATESVVFELRQALEDEIDARLHVEVGRVLLDRAKAGPAEAGVLTRIEKLVRPVQTRVDNLLDRTGTLMNRLTERVSELARTIPKVNGLCFFDRETPQGGTVQEEYQRCLAEDSPDPTEDWREALERVAEEVIGHWVTLSEAVIPVGGGHRDWLMEEFKQHLEENVIPLEDAVTLERQARRPFLRLRNVDVLARWRKGQEAPKQLAQEVARKAHPFLEVNTALAERGGRSPIPIRRILLEPKSQHDQDFFDAIKNSFPAERANSPDLSRAILLEELYRFPLSGVTAILGRDQLHSTYCADFPTFHTRTDVAWTGLSEAELERVRKAEELVALGLLLCILEPKGGALVVPGTAKGIGDNGNRRLFLNLTSATRQLAKAETDLDGLPLKSTMENLENLVEEARVEAGEGTPEERDVDFIKLLVKNLEAHKGGEVPDWDKRLVSQWLNRFCARSSDLYLALGRVFPPDEGRLKRLRKKKGDKKPKGGQYSEDGLYCVECGGGLGMDEREAAKNGWRCYVDPSHYFGPEAL